LTYLGICGQYVPDILNGIRQQAAQEQAKTAGAPSAEPGAAVTPVSSTAAEAGPEGPAPKPAPSFGGFVMALGLLVGLALAVPFLGGFQNIIGILIIGFAVYEAWKINRRVPIRIEGPFRLGTEAR
jgi:predicted lipid-binding transport protein (Tim44 family)